MEIIKFKAGLLMDHGIHAQIKGQKDRLKMCVYNVCVILLRLLNVENDMAK